MSVIYQRLSTSRPTDNTQRSGPYVSLRDGPHDLPQICRIEHIPGAAVCYSCDAVHVDGRYMLKA